MTKGNETYLNFEIHASCICLTQYKYKNNHHLSKMFKRKHSVVCCRILQFSCHSASLNYRICFPNKLNSTCTCVGVLLNVLIFRYLKIIAKKIVFLYLDVILNEMNRSLILKERYGYFSVFFIGVDKMRFFFHFMSF